MESQPLLSARRRALLAGEVILACAQATGTNFTLAGFFYDTSTDHDRWQPGLAMDGDTTQTHREFDNPTGLGSLIDLLVPGDEKVPFWNSLQLKTDALYLNGASHIQDKSWSPTRIYRGLYWPLDSVEISAHRRLDLVSLATRAAVDPEDACAALLHRA